MIDPRRASYLGAFISGLILFGSMSYLPTTLTHYKTLEITADYVMGDGLEEEIRYSIRSAIETTAMTILLTTLPISFFASYLMFSPVDKAKYYRLTQEEKDLVDIMRKEV